MFLRAKLIKARHIETGLQPQCGEISRKGNRILTNEIAGHLFYSGILIVIIFVYAKYMRTYTASTYMQHIYIHI